MTDLASYACFADESRGRRYPERQSEVRGPRDIFQRDRDRIIHSISFRRLRHKTQVFIAPDGDHYRVRLTHSLEVAQIGRTIARALGLNEDLTDIGHPPFGHAGEDALAEAMQNFGGFDHNAQTLRMLTLLDSPYPEWPGLNLSWELLEGLAKHNGPVKNPNWALAQINSDYDLQLDNWPSLEAQVAAIADDIAYDNHDIDDGIRAGLLNFGQLLALPFVADRWGKIVARYPGLNPEKLLPELIREQIGVMVNDVITATTQRISDARINTVEDVRSAGRMLAGFSESVAQQERQLKKFMYANLYHHPTQLMAADEARQIIVELYRAIDQDNAHLPSEWLAHLPACEPERSRHIADFLAGMTDRFAQNCHQKICLSQNL
jgi:dGTPase